MQVMVIEIFSETNKLKMSFYEKGKSTDHRNYSEKIISVEHINSICSDITLLFNKASKSSVLQENYTQELRKNTQLLYDSLLSNPIKEQIKYSKAKYLIFSIDEHLVHIPWELLHDGVNFVCLRFATGRTVRTQQTFHNVNYRNLASPFKMLALCDPLGNLKCAYDEGIAIRNKIEKNKHSIRVVLKTTEIDLRYVRKNIRDYDIVHFAGHSDYDSQNPSKGGWLLADGKFTQDDIANLGSSSAFPSIIFSNACQSAKTEQWTVKPGYEDRIYGLANAFLLAGVRHYIGTFWRILDEPCLLFAVEFYNNISKGLAIGEALRLARLNLIEKYGESSIAWSSYVLYGDPSYNFASIHTNTSAVGGKSSPFYKRLIMLVVLSLCIAGSGLFYYKYFYNLSLNLSVMRFDNLDTGEKDLRLPRSIVENLKNISSANIVDINLYMEDHSIKDIAQKFKVKRVLSGQYHKDGGLYTVQLNAVNPQTGKILDTREIVIEDSPRLAQDLSLQVLDMLKLGLSKKEKNELLRKPTENEEAYRLFMQSWDFYLAEEYDKALRACKKALEIDPEYLQVFMRMGNIYDRMNQRDRALDAYYQYAELSEKRGDLYNLANAYANIGWILETQDQMDSAFNYYNKALKLSKDAGDPYAEAKTYDLLGYWYFKKGQLNEALSFITKSIEINEKRQYIYNHKLFLANNFNKIAIIYDRENQYAKSIEYFNKALAIYRDLGDTGNCKYTIERINAVYSRQKDSQASSAMHGFKPTQEIVLQDKSKARTISHKVIFKEDAGMLQACELYYLALDYFSKQNYFEAIEACKKAYDLSPNFHEPLEYLSHIYITLGEWDKALDYCKQCLEITERKKDHVSHAFALISMGAIYEKKDQGDEALKYYLKSRDAAKKLGDPSILANSYHALGLWYSYHEYAEKIALEYLHKAELMIRNDNLKSRLGPLYTDIALVYAYAYDINNAETYIQKAFELVKDLDNNKELLLSYYTTKSYLEKIKGEYDNSIVYLERSLELAEQLGMHYDIAYNRWRTGQLYGEKGDYVEALNQFEKSLEFYLSRKEKKMIAYIYEDSAAAYAKMDNFKDAVNYIQLAMSIYIELDDKLGISSCYDTEGIVHFYMRNYDKALESYNLALEVSKQDYLDDYEDYSIYGNIGEVYYKLGHYDKALEFYKIASDYSEICKSRPYKAWIYQYTGLAYDKKGLTKMALEYLSKGRDLIYEMGIEKAREYQEGLRRLEELQQTF
jgi:tetratricopeptide (TPR) repeat protein